MSWSSNAPGCPLEFQNLPRAQRTETLRRNFRFPQRIGQRKKRRIDRLVGELKRAVVMAERALGAAIDERLYRLRRVHVLVGHEPARLVCADRQKCELERAVALSCIAEMPAFAVAGIADEINAAGGRFH